MTGVILWEVLTLRKPWAGWKNFDLWCEVQRGGRPEVRADEKAGAPKGYIELMNKMWQHDAARRPHFRHALDALNKIMMKHVVVEDSSIAGGAANKKKFSTMEKKLPRMQDSIQKVVNAHKKGKKGKKKHKKGKESAAEMQNVVGGGGAGSDDDGDPGAQAALEGWLDKQRGVAAGAAAEKAIAAAVERVANAATALSAAEADLARENSEEIAEIESGAVSEEAQERRSLQVLAAKDKKDAAKAELNAARASLESLRSSGSAGGAARAASPGGGRKKKKKKKKSPQQNRNLPKLPAGWRRVASRSRPGQFSYINCYTNETIAWMPIRAASRETGNLPPLVKQKKKSKQQSLAKDPIAELKELKVRYDRGDIDKDAFEAQKRELLELFAKGSKATV